MNGTGKSFGLSGEGRSGRRHGKRSLTPKDMSKRPSRSGPKRPVGRPGPGGPSGGRPHRAVKRTARRKPASRRPAARAVARKAAVAARPMPVPPRRRPISARPAARPATQNAELWAEIEQIQARFAELESASQLSAVYSAIGDFDARLVELPTTLDTLRDRGYVHSGQLDEMLEALDNRWDLVRPRVESALRSHVTRLDQDLDQAERSIQSLRASRSAINAANSKVNSLSQQIQSAEDAVEGLYEGMEAELSGVAYQINVISRMMDQLDESTDIRLLQAEGPLLAVKCVWQQDGKDDPEGLLVLTDQRLFFEQRQEVVTKKVLGLFKADSEIQQQLLLEVRVVDIESVTDKEEGGFLGMGKDDILEMVLAPTAPVSRVRFHVKGQESADWAAAIKRVQTGEIDEDRADEYVDELEEAEATAAAFPDVCFNCFAAVPPQPRGIVSVTCDFCGTVITSEASEGSE